MHLGLTLNMNLSSIGADIWHRTTRILDGSLPNRGKRVVFLASLAANLGTASSFTKETRIKLNRVMCLASGDSALVVPFELSRVIWRGKSGVEIFHFDPKAAPLTQDMIEQMASSVVKAMPSWLHYDINEKIQSDVSTLLRHRMEVFGF